MQNGQIFVIKAVAKAEYRIGLEQGTDNILYNVAIL
jgi:hypothetical protein